MNKISVPQDYNYIGAFLTLNCNYRCGYCINFPGKTKHKYGQLTGKEWVRGLNRLSTRDDLPVTLQGGEPSLHKDFIYIINNRDPRINIDILTNLQFDVDVFIKKVDPGLLKRKAKYPSIRVSFHPEEMELERTIDDVFRMQEAGFSIGLFAINHPEYAGIVDKAGLICRKRKIDFRIKEFLGIYNKKILGRYKYPEAVAGKRASKVMCKSSELLIAPDGGIYQCHNYLYSRKENIGNILDHDHRIIDEFRGCDSFGECNPCDIKIKNNRFQEFGHTAVTIKTK